MTLLDGLIPVPALAEVNEAVLDLPLGRAWELVRHVDLGSSRIVRALFALRELPARLTGESVDPEPLTSRVDDLRSSVTRPGFQILAEDPPREFAVGAIGKVWHLDIPFVHVPDPKAFLAFREPGYVKVAWSLRLSPVDEDHTTIAIEVRVSATDEASWKNFRRYFTLIGPASRLIRRILLAAIVNEHRTRQSSDDGRPLPGDDLLEDAAAQVTHSITVAAPPREIWPWLIQMGCRRGGFYSWDALDNGGERSAREVHPELQSLRRGDVIPATPTGDDGFEVLAIDEPHALVLGGLFDTKAKVQLPFAAIRPRYYWQVTWAFVLERVDDAHTRLLVRGRAACPPDGRLHLTAMRVVHDFMETAQLRHLAARIEGRAPKSDARDVVEAVSGIAIMAAALLTPFRRAARSHWGLAAEEAARAYAGDDLVPEPSWSFTHAVEVERPADEVWPWLAQIGADKAGFYSYQALENLAGCGIRNAETVHPSWEVREGDALRLHPDMPALPVVSVEPGRWFVAHAPLDPAAREAGRPWTTMSWLFSVEPRGNTRCRVISRYRSSCSDDVSTRLSFGPAILEPISFAMDRRMLLGVKERAEGSARRAAEPLRRMTTRSPSL